MTMFDAAEVMDKATFKESTRYSEGVSYALVNGAPVAKDGQLLLASLLGNPFVRRPNQLSYLYFARLFRKG